MTQQSIRFPVSGVETEALSAGDTVSISGQVITARDKAHQYLYNEKPDVGVLPFDLAGSLIYHCGPVIKKNNSEYSVVACGPTTSARVEMYEPWVIGHYGIRAVMGKGGMGPKTLSALQEYGAVYLQTIGGAASYLAERVKRVVTVFKLEEFGMPEALWFIEVEDFPAIVTMDSRGNSLHETVRKDSEEIYRMLLSSGPDKR